MTESLRILHVFELGPLRDGSFTGGIENHIIRLLSELTRMGHECTLLTGSIPNTKQYDEIKGVHIIRTASLGILNKFWNPYNLKVGRQAIFLPLAFQNILKGKGKWDILHGHIYMPGLAVAFASRIISTPSFNTIHGSYYDFWSQISSNQTTATAFRTMERILAPFIAKRVRKQIHTDHYFAKKVISWGILPDKIAVIHNGVDADLFQPCATHSPQFGNIPQIVAVRRLVPKNGIHYFLQAIKMVQRETPIEAIIIGDGPQREELEIQTRKLGIENQVKWVGRVPNNLVPNWLAPATIVAVPSLIEASSIGLLEGMAMGKPCIASSIPGIKEISSSEVVRYCKPGDPESIATAILDILSNPKKAKKMGEKARQHVIQNFSQEKVALKHLEVYQMNM